MVGQPLKPLNNPVEAYALSNKFDSQAPWYDQALQVMSNPLGPMFGGLAADRAFDAMDDNDRVLAELKAAGVPITTDRYGNYIPAGGSNGLLASLGRSMGLGGGGSGGGNGLLGAYYGGYVRDASGNPIRGGDGFVTYGSGPAMNDNSPSPNGFQAGEVGIDQ